MVLNKIATLVLASALGEGAASCANNNYENTNTAATQTAREVEKEDGSMVSTTTAPDGTVTEVRTFESGEVARVTRTTPREGERTALDNTMLLYCSSMLTGNHDATQLPVVLLGGAGGRIKGGRVLDYSGKPNRKMCSLYLSLLDKCGVRMTEFGDSKERLAEI